jgi:DNA-binding GntR family transcriptional regulator
MVYDAVLSDIVRHVYTTSSIITEGSLIAKYHVSKSPVREALIELCQDGVLQSIPRAGYRMLPLDYKEVDDALAVRTIIELNALDAAFPHITDEELDKLEADARKHQKNLENTDAYLRWTSNVSYHLELCSLSGNRFFVSVLDSLLKVCLRGASNYFGTPLDYDLGDSTSRHIQLIEKLRSRDLPGAKVVLKADIEGFRAAFLSH